MQIESEKLGPPGIRGELHILGKLAEDQRSDASQLYDRTEREFKVVGRLGKAPPDTDTIKGDFGNNDGASYILIPPDAKLSRVRCREGTFEFGKNEDGEKSVVEFECRATGPTEARRKFQETVLPFLDYLSYLANVPVIITMIRVEDSANDRIVIDYVGPYRKATVYPHTSHLFVDMAAVYAMYREAKNSHSDFYRFLCYYKLLEGLLGKLRAEVFVRAKEQGATLSGLKDIIPLAEEIAVEFQQYVGKSVKVFFDDVLTPRFRNAVAHFVTDGGGILNVSSPEHIESYARIIYVSEICVRVVIQNHEALLRQLQRGV